MGKFIEIESQIEVTKGEEEERDDLGARVSSAWNSCWNDENFWKCIGVMIT